MDVEGAVRDVGWGDAAWMSSIAVALVIVAVGITFFVILILTALRYAFSSEIFGVTSRLLGGQPRCSTADFALTVGT
jgi:hypothetical protein